ncbi:Arylsulfatase A [Haladaptatus litoreus]|uniref:Arylsulfatase A n=1 Tax=Haladaptatus litoreus TaxID=553468 RepID=A0A1N7DF54_9EURY|nr:sulfatase [Haladaptatus litoreus]SIR74509.1 Arylsulfatase A [Haladaptatus litoreus]
MRIVYIDVDSLRADYVGAYGQAAPTTPNIDRLAADAVRFDTAYVANSPCMPSRAALLTGRYGIHNGVVTHGAKSQTIHNPRHSTDWAGSWGESTEDHRDWWHLPELLFQNRITTGAVSSFPRHPAPWFYHVWHDFHHPQEPTGKGETFQTPRAETVSEKAIQFIESHTSEEFFLYAQYWDPHGPYNRPGAEVERFRDSPVPPYPTEEQIAEHRTWNAWRSATHMDIDGRDDIAEMLAHYRAEIRYADRHIGRVIEHLEDEGLYDDTLIVVTADHGEEFGEHGLYREHWSTHDGTQRVPLIIKPPASSPVERGVRDQLVTNVDMAPTLAEYAEIEPPAQWQGQSLVPLIRNSDADWRSHIVFDHGLYTAQRAIRTERWKLVRTYHPGMWADSVPNYQLYDMNADPWEQNDCSSDNLEVVSGLENQLLLWADEHVGIHEDPLHAVVRDGPAGTNAYREWDDA